MLTATLDPQHQLERILEANEKLYAQWRKRPPRSQPIDTLIFADAHPLTPSEEAHIRDVMAGAAAGLDADSHTLEMVLDALGILPGHPAAMPTGVADISPKRQYGQCRICQRNSIPVRKNGRLVGHSRVHRLPVAEARCPGGDTLPVPRKAAAA